MPHLVVIATSKFDYAKTRIDKFGLQWIIITVRYQPAALNQVKALQQASYIVIYLENSLITSSKLWN